MSILKIDKASCLARFYKSSKLTRNLDNGNEPAAFKYYAESGLFAVSISIYHLVYFSSVVFFVKYSTDTNVAEEQVAINTVEGSNSIIEWGMRDSALTNVLCRIANQQTRKNVD